MACVDACMFKTAKFPNEFDFGLSNRKPVYIPFPQATPLVALIDEETCIHFRTGQMQATLR